MNLIVKEILLYHLIKSKSRNKKDLLIKDNGVYKSLNRNKISHKLIIDLKFSCKSKENNDKRDNTIIKNFNS